MNGTSSTGQDESPDGAVERFVIVGVDTHQRTHHAAMIDQDGRLLGDREFPATRDG
jgi:hypothetical protein